MVTNTKRIEESKDDFTKKRLKRLKRENDIIKHKDVKIGANYKDPKKCPFCVESISLLQPIILSFLLVLAVFNVSLLLHN